MKTKLIEYTMRNLPLLSFLTEHGNSIVAVAFGLYLMVGRV
jgi:hypothetical protein